MPPLENSDSGLNAYKDINSGTIDDKLSQAPLNQYRGNFQNSGASDFENDINVGINDLEKVTIGMIPKEY